MRVSKKFLSRGALLLVLPLAAIGELSEAATTQEDTQGDLVNPWLEETLAAETDEPATAEPVEDPTAEPTPYPTAEPSTAEPTSNPTPDPTTAEPTPKPTPNPTPTPSYQPTVMPTFVPTTAPTQVWSNMLQMDKEVIIGLLVSSGAVLLLLSYYCLNCRRWKDGHSPSKSLNWLFFINKSSNALIDNSESQKNIKKDYGGTGAAKLGKTTDLEVGGAPDDSSSSSSTGSTIYETDSSYTDGSSYSYTVRDSDESASETTDDSYTTATTALPSIPEEKRDHPLTYTRGHMVDSPQPNMNLPPASQARQVLETGADGNHPGEDEKTITSEPLAFDSGLAVLAAAGFDSANGGVQGIYGMTPSERAECERELEEVQAEERRSRKRKRRRHSRSGSTASTKKKFKEGDHTTGDSETDDNRRSRKRSSKKRRSRKRSSRKKAKTSLDDEKVEVPTTQNLGLHGPARQSTDGGHTFILSPDEVIANVEANMERPDKPPRVSRKKRRKKAKSAREPKTEPGGPDALSVILSDHAPSEASTLSGVATIRKKSIRKHVRSRRGKSLEVSKSGPEYAYHVVSSPRDRSNSPLRKRKLPASLKKKNPPVQEEERKQPAPGSASTPLAVLWDAESPKLGHSPGSPKSPTTEEEAAVELEPAAPPEDPRPRENYVPKPKLEEQNSFEALANSVALKEKQETDFLNSLAMDIREIVSKANGGLHDHTDKRSSTGRNSASNVTSVPNNSEFDELLI